MPLRFSHIEFASYSNIEVDDARRFRATAFGTGANTFDSINNKLIEFHL